MATATARWGLRYYTVGTESFTVEMRRGKLWGVHRNIPNGFGVVTPEQRAAVVELHRKQMRAERMGANTLKSAGTHGEALQA